MRFYDKMDITSECFLCHRNANSCQWTVLQAIQYTVTKQIYFEQELYTYLFQNFIMKMQMVLSENNLHTQIKNRKLRCDI